MSRVRLPQGNWHVFDFKAFGRSWGLRIPKVKIERYPRSAALYWVLAIWLRAPMMLIDSMSMPARWIGRAAISIMLAVCGLIISPSLLALHMVCSLLGPVLGIRSVNVDLTRQFREEYVNAITANRCSDVARNMGAHGFSGADVARVMWAFREMDKEAINTGEISDEAIIKIAEELASDPKSVQVILASVTRHQKEAEDAVREGIGLVEKFTTRANLVADGDPETVKIEARRMLLTYASMQ